MSIEWPSNTSGHAQATDEVSDPVNAVKAEPNKELADARLLRTLNSWWLEARDAHVANRIEQHLDADYYDHNQLAEAVKAELRARGQAPLQFNLVHAAINWIIGTERRTRVDWKILPRGPEDAGLAQAKQHVLKYVDDVNDAAHARSAAFSHAIKVGIGWTEECYDPDADEPVVVRHEDWKCIWSDPFAKKLDLADARYLHRVKWLDIDYAQQQWPKFADALARSARSADEIDLEDCDDPADVPGLFFSRTTDSGLGMGSSGVLGATGQRRLRSRVRIIETWYRKPMRRQRMIGILPQFDRQLFDPNNPAHARAVNAGQVQLIDAVVTEIHKACWQPGLLLEAKKEPYKHNRYPLTPTICYRNDKSGMPYGMIRGMRDPQDDYNRRRGKSLFLLSTNRLIYEDGVVDQEDEDDFLDEAAKPNAQLRVRAGALQNNRIKFESGTELAMAQLQLGNESKIQVYEGSGITRENLGQDGTGTLSGRAILAKQQQGAVSTAEPFDNYRFSFRQSGRKTLSNTEQFMSMPKRIRITGPSGRDDWLSINEPHVDPLTGEVWFDNDLTKSESDYHVDQQDYRETMRMAMAESLFEVIRNLPPELQLGMLDLAIELTDLPNRDELVRRIRAMNNQAAPGDEQNPEVIAAKQAQAQAEAQEAQLVQAERTAKVRKDNAAALKAEQDARKVNVQTKAEALNTAAILEAAMPLAPSADRLTEFPAEAGVQTQ